MDKNKIRIGIAGATGLVGQEIQKILVERDYDMNNVVLLKSRNIKTDIGLDVVLMAIPETASWSLAPKFVKRGTLVIDDSAAFRYKKNVPLIIPEINEDKIKEHTGIISTPNCAVVPIALMFKALDPLKINIDNVRVSTYQSVSGAGREALKEFEDRKYEYSYDNVSPFIGDPLYQKGQYYTSEEEKIEFELRKILELDKLKISATCVRVPVSIGHSASVHFEIDKKVSRGRMINAIIKSSNKLNLNYCEVTQSIWTHNRDEIFIGRMRQDKVSNGNGFVCWVAGNNLRKGSALNSVQIMEKALDIK